MLIRLLFACSAVYDLVLGVAFLLFAPALFGWMNVPPPNHFGYVHFPACLLIIFGLMFALIAVNPRERRDLIVMGVLLKVSYSGVVFYHWAAAGVPDIWKPFAWFDLIFAVLFIWAYLVIGRTANRQIQGAQPV